MSDAPNPLGSVRVRIPFDRVAADHVEPAIDEWLAYAEAALVAIESSPQPPTYNNVLQELEDATEGLEYAMTIVAHLEAVATTPDLRAAHQAVQPRVAQFYARIPLRSELWQRLQCYAASPAAQALTGARRRHLKQTLKEFRRHGAELDAAGKERLAQIDVALAELCTKFAQHVLDATHDFELVITDESQLAGLPETIRDAAAQSAGNRGQTGWRFTLDGPSYVPVMTYLDDAGLREQMWRAYHTRATSGERNNLPLIQEILKLRTEKASLLGYGDFADFVLEDRMAKSGRRARSFVADLRDRTESSFRAENRALLAFSARDVLRPWDVGYTAEKQRKELYDFDDEALRPYFPADRVIEGMFEVVQRLYGLRIDLTHELSTWHPDVRCYRVIDGDETELGFFYADLHPRESKRDGAWMNGLITGQPRANLARKHVGLICANLNPPVGDKPALLTHNDVETLFHEFGHLMHHMLSTVDIRSMGGSNVAWDFVELPSQIMENWCWERAALDVFSGHWDTGEPIPEDLFQRMHAARTFRAANAMMHQLGLAAADLSLHVDYDPKCDGELLAYANQILQAHTPAPLPSDYAMIASFHHLFGYPVAYAAGYYSYKWAEVLDADAFTKFKSVGVFDREVGDAFRNTILSKGDAADPMDLYRAFMGRPPSQDALLERAGLSRS